MPRAASTRTAASDRAGRAWSYRRPASAPRKAGVPLAARSGRCSAPCPIAGAARGSGRASPRCRQASRHATPAALAVLGRAGVDRNRRCGRCHQHSGEHHRSGRIICQIIAKPRYPVGEGCRDQMPRIGRMRIFGFVTPRMQRRVRPSATALLIGGVYLVSPLGAALADDTAEDLKQLRAAIQKELADLKKREQKLHQEFLRLDQKSQLLDDQLRKLRAAGAGPGTATPTAPVGGGVPLAAAVNPSRPAGTEVAQTSAPSPAPQPTRESSAPAAAAPPAGGESAPISGPSAEEQQARQVVETAPTLSSVGGVLTPKGQIVIDPSIEYDYWAQNQLGVNGFQIIPGITFGNIFVTRFEQNITTAAVTGRWGVTDRLELNAKVPFVYNTGSTSSLIPVGPTAQLLSVSANGSGIGDVLGGASYQINSGEGGWPIFVGNFLFKTVTGTSPFQVPIITLNDPNGQFLSGTPKKLATGTGFYQLTPSLTVLLPTAPGVLLPISSSSTTSPGPSRSRTVKGARRPRSICSPGKPRQS